MESKTEQTPQAVGSGEGFGIFTQEEILTLKIAEFSLHRDFLHSAVRSLFSGVRPAGKSHFQRTVLLEDLKELERRMDDAMAIKWPFSPNTQGVADGRSSEPKSNP